MVDNLGHFHQSRKVSNYRATHRTYESLKIEDCVLRPMQQYTRLRAYLLVFTIIRKFTTSK